MLSYWMQTVENKTVLELREIASPTPGPKQILVRLHAASLNRGEFVIGHGLHKSGQANPIGMEGAGVVVALGQYCPMGQAMQLAALAAPVLALYVPAAQLIGLTEGAGQ